MAFSGIGSLSSAIHNENDNKGSFAFYTTTKLNNDYTDLYKSLLAAKTCQSGAVLPSGAVLFSYSCAIAFPP
jgi:hypothetical protein